MGVHAALGGAWLSAGRALWGWGLAGRLEQRRGGDRVREGLERNEAGQGAASRREETERVWGGGKRQREREEEERRVWGQQLLRLPSGGSGERGAVGRGDRGSLHGDRWGLT